MLGSETSQLPEKGATKVTMAGEGGWLKVPVAVNVTRPLVNICASALAGEIDMESNTRLLAFMVFMEPPQPATIATDNKIKRRPKRS